MPLRFPNYKIKKQIIYISSVLLDKFQLFHKIPFIKEISCKLTEKINVKEYSRNSKVMVSMIIVLTFISLVQ